ncbi:MAG: hypothetical protein IE909_14910, partial [Campylobacterales bacterium]|nr:hypothetical protein [Campylobacterales bacterium]
MKQSLITAIALYATVLGAYDINLNGKWQLLGSSSELNTSVFSSSCAKYLWKYDSDNSKWVLSVVDGQLYNYSGEYFETIKPNEGYWILSDSNCQVTVVDSVASSTTVCASANQVELVTYRDWSNDGSVDSEQTIKYGLDANGNVVSKYISYDGDSNFELSTYAYDANGKLLTITQNYSYSNNYDSDDFMEYISSHQIIYTLEYDLAGNMTKISVDRSFTDKSDNNGDNLYENENSNQYDTQYVTLTYNTNNLLQTISSISSYINDYDNDGNIDSNNTILSLSEYIYTVDVLSQIKTTSQYKNESKNIYDRNNDGKNDIVYYLNESNYEELENIGSNGKVYSSSANSQYSDITMYDLSSDGSIDERYDNEHYNESNTTYTYNDLDMVLSTNRVENSIEKSDQNSTEAIEQTVSQHIYDSNTNFEYTFDASNN